MAGLSLRVIDNTALVKAASEAQIKRALTVMAETAEGYAKLNCPVDTGRLRASIAHEINTGEKSAMIGINVEYGTYVELGTSKMRAKPYLRPAISDHTGEYQQIIESIFKTIQVNEKVYKRFGIKNVRLQYTRTSVVDS